MALPGRTSSYREPAGVGTAGAAGQEPGPQVSQVALQLAPASSSAAPKRRAASPRASRASSRPAAPPASTLAGVVAHVCTRTGTGWFVARLRPAPDSLPEAELARGVLAGPHDRDAGTVAICGVSATLRERDEVTLEGAWTDNSKYGRQFKFSSALVARPSDERGVALWLAQHLSSCGQGRGDLIAATWGRGPEGIAGVWAHLDAPDAVAQLQALGIPGRAAELLHASYLESGHLREIGAWLRGLVGPASSEQILAAYGALARQRLEADPYGALMQLDNWGFLRADEVARAMSIPEGGAARVRAAIVHALQEAGKEGQTYLPIYTPESALPEAAKAYARAEGKKPQLPFTAGLLDCLQVMGVDVVRAVHVLREMHVEAEALIASRGASRLHPDGTVMSAEECGLPSNEQAAARALVKRRGMLVRLDGVTGPLEGNDLRGADAWILQRWQTTQEIAALVAEMMGGERAAGSTRPPAPIAFANGTPTDEQAAAAQMALDSPARIVELVGGPGTGKSWLLRGIIDGARARRWRVLVAAPTGRAAKRATEMTGCVAKTLHRLLDFHPVDGWRRNQQHPLEADLIILDESSMLDEEMMLALLRAIPPHGRLLLVGDADQLPSVGAGNVLYDLRQSGAIPIARLTKVLRQSERSAIHTNAQRINAGLMPVIDNQRFDDFIWIDEEDTDQIVGLVQKVATTTLHRRWPTNPETGKPYGPGDMMVLSPQHKGKAGVAALNTAMREAMNPAPLLPDGTPDTRGDFVHGDTIFRVGDPVLCNGNDYIREVFNGDRGVIVAVRTASDPGGEALDVDYSQSGGRVCTYYRSDLRVHDNKSALIVAYATSVHKAQGSEAPITIMVIHSTHSHTLSRQVLYTGGTRPRHILIIIGDEKGMRRAVNTNAAVRYTGLTKMVREATTNGLEQSHDPHGLDAHAESPGTADARPGGPAGASPQGQGEAVDAPALAGEHSGLAAPAPVPLCGDAAGGVEQESAEPVSSPPPPAPVAPAPAAPAPSAPLALQTCPECGGTVPWHRGACSMPPGTTLDDLAAARTARLAALPYRDDLAAPPDPAAPAPPDPAPPVPLCGCGHEAAEHYGSQECRECMCGRYTPRGTMPRRPVVPPRSKTGREWRGRVEG